MSGGTLNTSCIAAVLDRPASGTLTVAIVVGALGWLLHGYFYWTKRPRLLEPMGTRRPDHLRR